VAVTKADERLLAELGYKQEFQREFTPLEVYFTSYLLTSLPLTNRNCRYLEFRSVSLDSCPLSRQCRVLLFSPAKLFTVIYSSVLFYSIPNGGPVAMVWGVSLYHSHWPGLLLKGLQWAVASLFIVSIGMAMAELASAAPTSGGVSDAQNCFGKQRSNRTQNLSRDQLYFWTHTYSSPKCRNLLAWIVGCRSLSLY